MTCALSRDFIDTYRVYVEYCHTDMVTLGTVLALIGLTYRDAPLTHIAQLSDAQHLFTAIEKLMGAADPALRGIVVLATCNRFGMYLDTVRFHDAIDAIVAAAADVLGISVQDAAQEFTACTGSTAANRLFRVAAGLDSMVVGEAEISGQVATAFQRALAGATSSSALNVLFQSAARVAKRVATDTNLGAAGRSIAAVALDAAERSIGPLSGAAVLLVGTGSYIRVVASTLKARECHDVSVFSSSGRQFEFAADRGLFAVDQEALAESLRRADLVVTCSGTGTVVLDAELMRSVMHQRGRPLQVVDLAVQPDVPEPTRQLPGVDVIGLEQVIDAASHTNAVATASITDAEVMIAAAVDEFVDEIATRRLDPAVVALRQHVTDLIDREIGRLSQRLPDEVMAEVQRSLRRIANSLLHTPTIQARTLARDGHGERYVDALHTLFGIDIPGADKGSALSTTAESDSQHR
ncbi:MAG: glutamyl-tRNA reductase [Nakamurella sp.]